MVKIVGKRTYEVIAASDFTYMVVRLLSRNWANSYDIQKWLYDYYDMLVKLAFYLDVSLSY
ncbi:hypothetical protein Plhal710r2_c031g0116131 [Plasmopara halstedii]